MRYLLTILSMILFYPGKPDYRSLVRPRIPVLCYHAIYTGKDKKASALAISRDQLNAQLKFLYDSGYHTVSPDQLYSYLTKDGPLPLKPILITFDDTRTEHLAIAAPLMEQYGFRGVFFIMTVPIGKPGYMTADAIRALSDSGHVIGAHTWDHPYLTRSGSWNYTIQVVQPKQLLEKITGKPVLYFAYPFGEWNENAISMLREGGFKAAFQLAGRLSGKYPEYTIQRMMVDGRWSGARLEEELNRIFIDDNHLR